MKRYFKDLGFMLVVDALAFALIWIVWREVGETLGEIDSQKEIIEFYGNLFLLLIILMGPVLHITATIEFLKPGALAKDIVRGINVNRLLLIVLGALIALSFVLKHNFINYIDKCGYTYCAEKSERTSFSKKYVFVRSGDLCNAK